MKIRHPVNSLRVITDPNKAVVAFEGMHVFFTMLREGFGAEITPEQLAYETGMTEAESERGLKWCIDQGMIITEGQPSD